MSASLPEEESVWFFGWKTWWGAFVLDGLPLPMQHPEESTQNQQLCPAYCSFPETKRAWKRMTWNMHGLIISAPCWVSRFLKRQKEVLLLWGCCVASPANSLPSMPEARLLRPSSTGDRPAAEVLSQSLLSSALSGSSVDGRLAPQQARPPDSAPGLPCPG